MSNFQEAYKGENEIAEAIMNDVASGDYTKNLTLAMRHAVAAVQETSTAKEQYLLAQSQAQSSIAIVLLLEDIAGYIMGEQQ